MWAGGKNLDPTEIRSPDCPARSQWLYRLRYPALSPGTYQLQTPVDLCEQTVLKYRE
jgi:hypothetical protein